MKGLLHAPFDRFRIGCFIAENQTLEHTVTFSENHEYTSIILPQQIFSFDPRGAPELAVLTFINN